MIDEANSKLCCILDEGYCVELTKNEEIEM